MVCQSGTHSSFYRDKVIHEIKVQSSVAVRLAHTFFSFSTEAPGLAIERGLGLLRIHAPKSPFMHPQCSDKLMARKNRHDILRAHTNHTTCGQV